MNQDGSTEENDNNRRREQTEIPFHVTHGPAMTPRMRLQHKLLDQAQSRMTTGLVTAAPSNSNTDEKYFNDDWGGDFVASDHGTGPAPNRSEDAAASSDGVVAETKVDLQETDAAAQDRNEMGTDQDGIKECCICLDASATHIFTPCGYFCICAHCQIPYADGTEKECPMCREEFKFVSRVV